MLVRPLLPVVACTALALTACSSKEEPARRTSKVNEENVAAVKSALSSFPMPLVDARAKVVAILGEPTKTEKDSLVWAGVNGDECRYVELVVKGDTANGMGSGLANKVIESEFKKCEARAEGK